VLKELLNSEKLVTLQQALQSGVSVLIEGLWNAPKALIAALAQQTTGKHVLILTGAGQEEARLYHDFAFFIDRPIVDFPAWETLPSENIPPSPDIVGERYKVLKEISSQPQPSIILSSLQACLQMLIPPARFQGLYLSLKTGDTLSYEDFIQQLNRMGYQRQPVTSEKGEYAIRGGIVDIFPVSSPDPYRIEFWGDEIESLRIYDPIGQKSVRSVTDLSITPAQELEFLKQSEQLSTILDYLGPNTLIIFDDLLTLEDKYASLVHICGTATRSFCRIEDFLDRLQNYQKIFWTQQPIEELSEVRLLEQMDKSFYSDNVPLHALSFQLFGRTLNAHRWQHAFVPLADYLLPEVADPQNLTGQELFLALGRLAGSDHHLHFLCATELEESSLQKKILEANLSLPKQTKTHIGYLSNGMALSDLKVVIAPMTEWTQRYKIRRQKQRSTYHTLPSEFIALTPGEMVVHLNHGIGRYLGLEKRPNHTGVLSEFFVLEYAEHAKLYVPLNQAHLLSKYIGANEEIPKMHTLGSNRWKRTKETTERAILAYAADLLQLYAQREIKGGFSFPEDSPDIKSFEEEFPYIETEDQLAAVDSIKQDMALPKAMDRLVCGDVGYGKTEVAMRAAFKAAVDGRKQVAVLVPTTVLAMQHYETFQERMSNFPLNVGILSRFRTPKQVRETLEQIAQGSIDIVIGTHRIISEDVTFKDLGLVIIDEEQRFGVKAKEHLKKLKAGVDCLTLSATPIPRTLYMSLIGARDMSVINTPPQDRLPITTLVTEANDQVIKSALLRELARDGQAYIIHNRVETIFDMAERIRKLLPQARLAVVHGQMDSHTIDQVFHAFKNARVDILIATTIIENGIDIPNANTILIHRADHFGLADLYQLRGRVGRWNRRAYAYFLVPNLHALPEISRKRLQALIEASGYGGGMKIAMRDLEIRGAGNILGHEQSGHVSAIGFQLYCKLLKRTILTLQGKVPSIISEVKLEFPFDARLPEEYVNEANLRMEMYQRFGEAISTEEIEALWAELQDRFGPAPEPAKWLYHTARIRAFAALHGYTLLKLDKLSLATEQQKGKQSIVRKLLFTIPKTPELFEERLIKVLQQQI
jgi:transcription-repair coupling factor (superfamily II helicase)